MSEFKVSAGERVKLDCNYSGEPTPEVIWTKEGSDSPIESNRTQAISVTTTPESTKLAFNNVTKAQEGTYILTVTNANGKETVSFKVVIRDRPSPPEELVTSLGSGK